MNWNTGSCCSDPAVRIDVAAKYQYLDNNYAAILILGIEYGVGWVEWSETQQIISAESCKHGTFRS